MMKPFRFNLFTGSALAVFLSASATTAYAKVPVSGPQVAHTISYDRYSFMIDGKRVYLWSGEFHPNRLPSPTLWTDIFQKMHAAGMNTVSIYFSWGYHSSAEGKFDFTGIRDMDRVLDAARDAGLYVIARPGPYINAELDSGGFPLWLTTHKINNRHMDPEYLKFADEWMTQIDSVIARHQLTDGRGSVIAYQVENEFYRNDDDGRAYMAHLEKKAREDGITVPLTGNHDGKFTSGLGAVEVSGWDHYPQGFNCSTPNVWKTAPDMSNEHGPDQPIFTAEFQGGSFDPWGGPGYEKCAQLINDQFASVFYKQNIAAGATAQSFYMFYGGTSWGWQAIPQNYTSYDYAAAITEARQFDPKFYEFKRIGYMLETEPSLRKTDSAPSWRIDNPSVIDITRRNPDTGAEFHYLRHGDIPSTAESSFHAIFRLPDGQSIEIPQAPDTAMSLDGRDAKLLISNGSLGATHLIYSTSELMVTEAIGQEDVAVFYGDTGSYGELLLAYDRQPKVEVLQGQAKTTYDKKSGLRLNYVHGALTKILVTGGARPLLLLIMDKAGTQSVWRAQTEQGPVLVLGSHLLRRASFNKGRLNLIGDSAGGDLELFADKVKALSWNGTPLNLTRLAANDLMASLPQVTPIHLPILSHWQMRQGAPESRFDFPDQDWTIADKATSASITKTETATSLLADDYGFHTGNTWYRGHFTLTDPAHAPTGIKIKVMSGGSAGAFSVWLNGHFLGSQVRDEEGTFGFPSAALRKGDNVLSVLTVDMGHDQDWNSKNANRNGRGIVAVTPLGVTALDLQWRLQGRTGGEGATDPVRGPYNLGGLYGERMGWPTGEGDDASWTAVAGEPDKAGVYWYRTDFRLDLPKDQDTSIGVAIKDPPGRHYRALIFVNGWQMGHYISDIGPQHAFPIPKDILKASGDNKIAIAVWKTDISSGGLGDVQLIDYGSFVSAQ